MPVVLVDQLTDSVEKNMARPKQKTNFSKGAKDRPFSMGVNCTQSHWDNIFGKKTDEQRKVEREAYMLEQKAKQEKELAEKIANLSPVRRDIYAGVYDWGSGKTWESGTQRREWMKREGRECTG